jgi:hypothetical protein
MAEEQETCASRTLTLTLAIPFHSPHHPTASSGLSPRCRRHGHEMSSPCWHCWRQGTARPASACKSPAHGQKAQSIVQYSTVCLRRTSDVSPELSYIKFSQAIMQLRIVLLLDRRRPAFVWTS